MQGWSGQPSVHLPVSSYSELVTKVCHAFTTSASTFTLYYAPAWCNPHDPFSVWFMDKQKVSSQDDLAYYLGSFPDARARHPLLLWQPPHDAPSSGGAKVPSPTKDEAPRLASSSPQRASPSIQSGSSGRSSTQQQSFAEPVYKRDGYRCVVAACAQQPVQAAHIVPVSEPRTKVGLEMSELLDLYQTINGISLCVTCHDYFDAGVSGTVKQAHTARSC